jgi:hypothetical protein
MLCLAIAGCAAASAVQLAPMALSATSALGASAMDAVGGHTSSERDDGGPRLDSQERCDELANANFDTIELRIDDTGPIMWRELQLSGLPASPQWRPIAGEYGSRAGWRPLGTLNAISFVPPLASSLKRGRPNYLAYAPSEPQTSAEEDQLVALTMDFGAGMGTFQWNGRAYQYTLVNKLPCFPAPVASG